MIGNIEDRLFVLDKKKFLGACQVDYRSDEPLQVREIDDGVILPLHFRTDHFQGDFAFEGGVCDKTGAFLAGLRRYTDPKYEPSNLSCLKAYTPDREPTARHETVIFGGVLYWIFGHAVTECLSRLWWFAEHPDTPYKVVFLDIPRNKGFQYWNILAAMGLPRDRIEVVTEPTRFDKIIVPDQAWIMYGEYHREMLSVYDAFKARVEPGPYKKVYLSRTEYFGKEEVNEAYYEDFFRRRGFVVIHPEKLPFPEQVSVIGGADELACLQSSLLYMTAFCKPGAKVTVLTRLDGILRPSVMAMQLRDVDYTIIHANYNFLPVTTWNSTAYLYGPTKQWIEYLDRAGVEYEENEVSFELYVKPYIYEYLTKWAGKAAVPSVYGTIHNRSLIDVVEGLNGLLLQKSIKRKELRDRDDCTRLKNETAAQKAKIRSQQEEIERLAERGLSLEKEGKGLRGRVDALKSALQEKMELSEDLARKNAAQGNTLSAQKKELDARAREIEAGKQTIEVQERLIGAKEQELEEKKKELDEIKKELDSKRKELDAQKKRATRLKKQITTMENSRSWRITRPLRAAGRAFRRIMRR